MPWRVFCGNWLFSDGATKLMGVQLISGDDVTLDDGLSDAGEERHSEPLLLNERFPGELW